MHFETSVDRGIDTTGEVGVGLVDEILHLTDIEAERIIQALPGKAGVWSRGDAQKIGLDCLIDGVTGVDDHTPVNWFFINLVTVFNAAAESMDELLDWIFPGQVEVALITGRIVEGIAKTIDPRIQNTDS